MKYHNSIKINSLCEISDRYDYYIFDAWGVLHDDKFRFPHVEFILNHLKKNNKRILILSNSPSPVQYFINDLNQRGVNNTIFDYVYTSGEEAQQWLKKYCSSKKINTFYYIGNNKHRTLLEGLPLEECDDPKRVDIIINTGPYNSDDQLSQYNNLINSFKNRFPIMLCANPDKYVLTRSGLKMCSGAIANLYQTHGGKVIYFGKPGRTVYKTCLAKLKANKTSTLVVGDSLSTDIYGANNSLLKSLWITTGVHSHETELNCYSTESKLKINFLFNTYNAYPTYIMHSNLR